MSSCDVETLTMSHSILTFHMSALFFPLLAFEGEREEESGDRLAGSIFSLEEPVDGNMMHPTFYRQSQPRP